jgi:hypothetical protein
MHTHVLNRQSKSRLRVAWLLAMLLPGGFQLRAKAQQERVRPIIEEKVRPAASLHA